MEIMFLNKTLRRTAKVIPGTFRQEHVTKKLTDPEMPILLQCSLIKGACSVYLNDTFTVDDVIAFATQSGRGSLQVGTMADHAVLDAEITCDPPCAHLQWIGRKMEG